MRYRSRLTIAQLLLLSFVGGILGIGFLAALAHGQCPPAGYTLIGQGDVPVSVSVDNSKYAVSGRIDLVGTNSQDAIFTIFSGVEGVIIEGCNGADQDTLAISGTYWAAVRCLGGVTVRNLTVIAAGPDGNPRSVSAEGGADLSMYDCRADGRVDVSNGTGSRVATIHLEDTSIICTNDPDGAALVLHGYQTGSSGDGNDARKCGAAGGEWASVTMVRCQVYNHLFPDGVDNESVGSFKCIDLYAEDCTFSSTSLTTNNGTNPIKQQAGRAEYVRCEFRSVNNVHQWSMLRGFTDPFKSGLAEQGDKVILDRCFWWTNGMGLSVEADTMEMKRSFGISMGEGISSSDEYAFRSAEYGSRHIIDGSLLIGLGGAVAYDADEGGWEYPADPPDTDGANDECCVDRQIIGSTLISSGSDAALYMANSSSEPQTRKFRIKNSIIRSLNGVAVEAGSGWDVYADSSNVWWSGGATTFLWDNNARTFSEWQGLGLGVNGVRADPLLTNPDADSLSNLVPLDGSPAIGLADPAWWELLVDYAGDARDNTSGGYSDSEPDPTGACCVTENCTVETLDSCISLNGGYQGDGTDCSPNPCPEFGACCFDSGSCGFQTQPLCENFLFGVYQGDETDCDPNPCPQPGACCKGPACTIEQAADCTGSFEGAGTVCDPNPCDQSPPTGACCVGETCTIETEADCDTASGAYQGNETTCSPNPCLPTGACCDAQVCSVVLQSGCAGTYQGDGTDCDPDPCVPPTGACCDVSTCSVETAADCAASGDEYQGNGTDCSPNPCPQPGACCVGETCSIEIQPDCGGTFQGEGSTCSPDPCVDAPIGEGACCVGAVCSLTTPAACAGIFQGLDTDCSPNPCPPYGACCLPAGSCFVAKVTLCLAGAGLFQGDGTDCDPDPCPSPVTTGACCTNATCNITTFAACGGIFQGLDTVCSPNPCLELGACCFSGQTCILTTTTRCISSKGFFQGTGSVCSPNPCP